MELPQAVTGSCLRRFSGSGREASAAATDVAADIEPPGAPRVMWVLLCEIDCSRVQRVTLGALVAVWGGCLKRFGLGN